VALREPHIICQHKLATWIGYNVICVLMLLTLAPATGGSAVNKQTMDCEAQLA